MYKNYRSYCFLALFAIVLAFDGFVAAGGSTSVTYLETILAAAPTYSATVPVTGSGTTTSPPAGKTPYVVRSFTVATSGSYTIATSIATVQQDTILVIYQNSFNPSSSSQNIVDGNDDNGASSFSSVTVSLSAGTTYYVVVTVWEVTVSNPLPYTFNVALTSNGGSVVTEPTYVCLSGCSACPNNILCTACSTGHLLPDSSACSNTCPQGTYVSSALQNAPCITANLITNGDFTTGIAGWTSTCASWNADHRMLLPGACQASFPVTFTAATTPLVVWLMTTGSVNIAVCPNSSPGKSCLLSGSTRTATVSGSGSYQSVTFGAANGMGTGYIILWTDSKKRSNTLVDKLWASQASNNAYGVGDPQFSGFNHQRYYFEGHADSYYNLYSDPTISAITLFDYANPITKYGTVMKTVSLSMVDTTIVVTMDPISVNVNGANLTHDHPVHITKPCVTVEYAHNAAKTLLKGVYIVTPDHKIFVAFSKQENQHVNSTYLDVSFSLVRGVNYYAASAYGGIVGASIGTPVDPELLESDLLAPSILSTKAKSNTYTQKAMSACPDAESKQQVLSAHKRSDTPSAGSAALFI